MQDTILFDKKKGEEFTEDYANSVILSAYKKTNSLTAENVRSLNSGTIHTSEKNSVNSDLLLRYPNYCSMIRSEDVVCVDVLDKPYDKLISETDRVLNKLVEA